MPLIFAITDPVRADSVAARAAGSAIVARVRGDPAVVDVQSAWTSPVPVRTTLVSADGRSGLVIVALRGGEESAPDAARSLVAGVEATVLPAHDGVDVRAGGSAMVLAEVNSQAQHDVLVMEAIAIPVSLLVLVWVFRGLSAAMVPVAVGGLTILASMSALRLLASWTPVSIFALNLTTALGLALAIDYTLLLVSRFRDDVAAGATRDQALLTTMTTAGRTVVISALTVALSMGTMVLFPMYFLKSFAYAGVTTVLLCALTAILVTPAAIVLLGPRVARPNAAHQTADRGFWYRWTKRVARRALPVAVVATLLLISLGLPFAGIKWGLPDDRVLPASASAHRVGDLLRSQFPGSESTVTIVLPDAGELTPQQLRDYTSGASRVPHVSTVSVAPPTVETGGIAVVTVGSTVPVFSAASERQLDLLRALPRPGDREVLVTGLEQVGRDSVDAIMRWLPAVLALIAAITLVLLFALTGSVVLPLKALVLNALSLSATFGALVWIFQDGRLGAFGTTPTGTLVANIPVLLFCIAFGLSMDYEVFILARIREYWLRSGRTRADNAESVTLGLARTGRVVTAAAAIMAIAFSALIAAQVSFLRMFGVGLTLAVLVDATVVRMVLLPAVMHLMGRWNWWAPAPLARLHASIRSLRDPP